MDAEGVGRVPGRVGSVLTAVVPIGVAGLAFGRLAAADGDVAVRLAAAAAIAAAALILVRTWTAAPGRRTLGLALLLAAAGALAPASLAALLVVAAALRIGRDVAGWLGLLAVCGLAFAHGAGLLVHGGEAVAPAAAALMVGLFAFGLAEPEQGAWCACEWSRRHAIAGLDSWYQARDALIVPPPSPAAASRRRSRRAASGSISTSPSPGAAAWSRAASNATAGRTSGRSPFASSARRCGSTSRRRSSARPASRRRWPTTCVPAGVRSGSTTSSRSGRSRSRTRRERVDTENWRRFAIHLPADLPCAFEGTLCAVRYTVEASRPRRLGRAVASLPLLVLEERSDPVVRIERTPVGEWRLFEWRDPATADFVFGPVAVAFEQRAPGDEPLPGEDRDAEILRRTGRVSGAA
jgi:hypothetical protein